MTKRERDLIRAIIKYEPHGTEVEIVRNARGVNISVRVNGRSVKDAGKKAEQEYDRLTAKYPAPANGGGE